MRKITILGTVAVLALGFVASANSASAQSYHRQGNLFAAIVGAALGTLAYDALTSGPPAQAYQQEEYPQQEAYGWPAQLWRRSSRPGRPTDVRTSTGRADGPGVQRIRGHLL